MARVLAEIPEAEPIIAVHGFHDIGLGIELHPELTKIITQQHADFAADRGIVDAILRGGEQPAALGNEAVIIDEAGSNSARANRASSVGAVAIPAGSATW